MKESVLEVAKMLRSEGHTVDAFCDGTSKRLAFNWSDLFRTVPQGKPLDTTKINGKEVFAYSKVQEAFQEDKKYLDWADATIMIVPCGKSAHLEGGYTVGQGKDLYIIGGFPAGEFEVMYGFARKIYYFSEIYKLLADLKEQERKKTG